MSSTQHNESLEEVSGKKRPGRGGWAPVWVLWLVDLRRARSPSILGKGYIWRPQVFSPQCNILHPGIWGLLSKNSLLNSSVSLLNLPLKKKAHAFLVLLGLPSLGSHRVGPDWSDLAAAPAVNAGCWCAWLISAAQEFCLFTSASLVRNTLNTQEFFLDY